MSVTDLTIVEVESTLGGDEKLANSKAYAPSRFAALAAFAS